jgi:hypothetical protein
MITRVLFSFFLAFALVAVAFCCKGYDPEPILNGIDFVLLPLTLIGVLAGLVTMGALWRPCLESLGFNYFLTVRYVQKGSGKSLEARDLWESCEPLRVLKTGICSQKIGGFAKEIETDYKVQKISRFEYLLVCEVSDITRGPNGPSMFD